MEEARIEFARAAWKNFLSLAPSPEDMKCVRDELVRLRKDSAASELVPFQQWDDCYLTWSDDWYIIYRKELDSREELVAILVVYVGKDIG